MVGVGGCDVLIYIYIYIVETMFREMLLGCCIRMLLKSLHLLYLVGIGFVGVYGSIELNCMVVV